MFNISNCLCLFIFFINILCCSCYVNYEIFHGFDKNKDKTTAKTSTNKSISTTEMYRATTAAHQIQTKFKWLDDKDGENIDVTEKVVSKDIHEETVTEPTGKITIAKMECPEMEHPVSFGTYEIPTQRDLVLFTKRTLLKMFNSYHEKTLILLKDIEEATKAASQHVKRCRGQYKEAFTTCIKGVSKKCITITKDLVAVLVRQKQSVRAIIEETTCNMKEIKPDPIELVKTLAMDEATLEFALPGFLRLLGGCSAHCYKQETSMPRSTKHRPSRRMTDQDLVVKHFLTKKNYIQLIQGN